MTKKTTPHHPHTFVTNMLASTGYMAMLFIWLLVLDLIVILFALAPVVNDLSVSVGEATSSVYVLEPAGSGTAESVAQGPLRFLLVVVLLILVWIFSYLVAKAASRTLRHLLKLMGRRPTLGLLTAAKYLIVSLGLIGLTVLLQFVSPLYADVKLPIAFLGLAAGFIAVGAIWAQRTLAERYKIAIDRVL